MIASEHLLRAFATTAFLGMVLLGPGCRTAPRATPGAGPAPESALERFEFQQPQMGLPFRMVLYAANATDADRAARAAFIRIAQLNLIMSDYEEESELNRLARTSNSGRTVPLSPDLWRVLERSQQLARESEGAFDITVGPYVQLWRKARRDRKLPPPERLAQARQSVGYRHLELFRSPASARLTAPSMRLDLGGIAKGYAVDEALQVLKAHGIRRALVSGGGDLAVSQPPPGRRAWRIELPPLDSSNAPPSQFVLLTNAALATSGDLYQRLDIDGRRYSHIVDPRTGIGLTDHSLVTVIAPDCMTADSLTKVVSVLGPEKGFPILRHHSGTVARALRKPGPSVEVHQTPGFARFLDPASHPPPPVPQRP